MKVSSMKYLGHPSSTKKCIPLAQKILIVNLAYPPCGQKTQVKSTAKKYGLWPSQIRYWKRNYAKFFISPDGTNPVPPTVAARVSMTIPGMVRRNQQLSLTRFFGGGRRHEFSDATILAVKEFYDNKRDKNFSVSIRLLKAEAKRVDPDACSSLSSNALRLRIRRLLDAWDISWRRSTHKAQQTRLGVAVMDDFREYVRQKAEMLGVDKTKVFNVDQTNVHYSQESKYTYAAKGTRTISVKDVDSSNRCTVMLGASAYGEKLPPFIVYKGSNGRGGKVKKELEAREGYPGGVEMTVQGNAWFDERVMLEWIEKIWKPFGAKDNNITYLILDECRVHMTTTIREAFENCNTEIEFIPGGFTDKLQVMDVGINKPFKNYIGECFDDWLVGKCHEDPTGRTPKPTRKDVAGWI
jgi:hypothetical protein